MRRLLTSLPIALLIVMALLVPASVYAGAPVPAFRIAHENDRVIESASPSLTSLLAENATVQLPEGLTLTKGIPFGPSGELSKGDQVAIRVKATNNGQLQINYALALTINGKTTGTPKQLSLEPGGSQDVVFLTTAQDTGINDIRVGNLQGFFTVKSGSIFDTFPLYLWIFFGVILLVVILLVVLMVMKPKKRPGTQMDKNKKQTKPKGKPGGREPQMQGGGSMQRPGMQNMPEGMLFGQQGQPGPSQDMGMQQQYQQQQPGWQPFQPQQPGMQQPFQPQQPGMQQPFQPQQPGMQQPYQPQQPGMQQPFQPQQPGMQQQFQPQQPGMQQPFQPQQPGMQQPFQPQQPGMQPPPPPGMQQPMRGPQYPPPPQMPHQGPQQPQAPGMQPGMQHQGPPQPGMPFVMQQPPMSHGLQAPPPPGMQPMHAPGQPPMPPSMQPPMGPGMQPQVPGAYQSMGMPKFSVSNLTITPNKVKVGEQISISIIVSNNGVQQGKYSVVLRVGGVVENITDLTLPPGASQTASFTVVKDAPGDYYADIDGLGGFFTVIPLTPPSFTVTTFSVGPERVRQGQAVTITASVINTGELIGSHSLILRVKGMAESQRDVTLGPGKTENVEFQIIKDTPGFYPVSLENWTGKFVVEMDWNG